MPDEERPERNLDVVTARYHRFIALGGGRSVQDDVKQLGQFSLEHEITAQHRELVSELAATGLPQVSIATILGICKTSLEKWFRYELDTGFEIAFANKCRTITLNSDKMGDANAALRWIQLHNKSVWAEKRERTQREHDADTEDGRRQLESAQAVVNALIAGLSTAPKLFKPSEQSGAQRAAGAVESKQRPPKSGATQRKAKGD